MSVLVVGANSFSGSTFCAHILSKGLKVIGASRSGLSADYFNVASWQPQYKTNFRFVKCDLNSDGDVWNLSEIIDETGVDRVVNFSAQGMVAESWLKPLDWYRTNVLGQVRLTEMLRKKEQIFRYVQVTTPEVYGSTDNWIEESFNFAPSTPYATSRAAFDLHLKALHEAYSFPVIWTRAANVYGPGQLLYRIIPRAFLSALCGREMTLHGGGVSERSFIHINDVCSATAEIMQHGKIGDTYHISTNEMISIRKLTERIFELCDAQFDKHVSLGEERLGKDAAYKLNSNKLRNELGWSESVSLSDGLEECKSWVEANLSTFAGLNWEYEHKS